MLRRNFVQGLFAGIATTFGWKSSDLPAKEISNIQPKELVYEFGRTKYIAVGHEIVRVEDTVYRTVKHYKNGKLHREDGPAEFNQYGHELWYRHGKLHREDGPAWSDPCGFKFWYRDGVLHRTDGPAVEIVKENCFQYYLNGKEVPPFGTV